MMLLENDPHAISAETSYRLERDGQQYDDRGRRRSLRAAAVRLWALSRHQQEEPSWPAGVMRTPTSMSHRAAH